MKKSYFKLWLICRLYGNYPTELSFEAFHKTFASRNEIELLYLYKTYCIHCPSQIKMGIQETLFHFHIDLSKYEKHLYQIPNLFMNKHFEKMSECFVDDTFCEMKKKSPTIF